MVYDSLDTHILGKVVEFRDEREKKLLNAHTDFTVNC